MKIFLTLILVLFASSVFADYLLDTPEVEIRAEIKTEYCTETYDNGTEYIVINGVYVKDTGERSRKQLPPIRLKVSNFTVAENLKLKDVKIMIEEKAKTKAKIAGTVK